MTDVLTAQDRKKNHEKAKKKLKIGRPEGSVKSNKILGTFLSVRVSPEIKKEIEKQASIEGFTLSAYISMTLKNLFGGK